jgi:hypothetical protein
MESVACITPPVKSDPILDEQLSHLDYVPTPQERQEAAEAFAMSDLCVGDAGRSFPELIERWAVLFKDCGTDPRYDWLSGRLAQLAKDARTLGATSPQQFDDREEVTFSCAVARSGLALVRQVAHNIFATEPTASYQLESASNMIRPSLNR